MQGGREQASGPHSSESTGWRIWQEFRGFRKAGEAGGQVHGIKGPALVLPPGAVFGLTLLSVTDVMGLWSGEDRGHGKGLADGLMGSL